LIFPFSASVTAFFEVLSTNGNTYLGGDDLDRNIVAYWMDEAGISAAELNSNKELSQGLRLRAEEAKKHLSQHDAFPYRMERPYFIHHQRKI
jgi:molecular chaperone DnaK (HSP70)